MSLLLEWPVTSPTLSVTLRNPELGDEEEVKTHAIIRRTRGGENKGFRDPDWLKVHTFKYDIRALNWEERTDLIEFLVATTGKRIQWTDHIAGVREGYVIGPTVEIVTLWDALYDPGMSETECALVFGDFITTLELMQDPDNSAYYLLVTEGDEQFQSEAAEDFGIERNET